MKCLDKKRIKMKCGETLALNERIMLSLVSTGVSISSRWYISIILIFINIIILFILYYHFKKMIIC